jgi:hypothetical protein
MKGDVIHQLKDPAKLTPYEETLLDLRKQGLTYGQMAEALDGKSNAKAICARFRVIREKVELMEAENARQSA